MSMPQRDAQLGRDDDRFRRWIQTLPSCISGEFSEYLENGEGRNPACHVRRASTSGTGYKAEYSCVPLTQAEHLVQHQKGEAACLNQFYGGVGTYTPFRAKEWFDEQVKKYREMWEKLQR